MYTIMNLNPSLLIEINSFNMYVQPRTYNTYQKFWHFEYFISLELCNIRTSSSSSSSFLTFIELFLFVLSYISIIFLNIKFHCDASSSKFIIRFLLRLYFLSLVVSAINTTDLVHLLTSFLFPSLFSFQTSFVGFFVCLSAQFSNCCG